MQNVFFKRDKMQAPELMQKIKYWVDTIDPIKELVTKTVDKTKFETFAEHYFNNHADEMAEDMDVMNYFAGISHVDYHDDLKMFLDTKFKSVRDIEKNIMNAIAKKKKRTANEDVDSLVEFISLLESFMDGLTHAIRVNGINHQFLEVSGESFSFFFDSIITLVTELMDELKEEEGQNKLLFTVAGLNSRVHTDLVKTQELASGEA